MQEGSPWVHWRDAAFTNQHLSIRKRFDRERKANQWEQLAVGYEALSKDFVESGQQMEAGLALNELAAAYRHLCDFERSESTARQALAIFDEIALPLGLAGSWHKLGDLFAEQHRWPDAEAAYAQSIKLKVECSDDEGEAITQDALATLLIKVSRFLEAQHAAKRSCEILLETGSPWQKWHALTRLLWIKVELGEFKAAQEITTRLAEAVRGNRELESAVGELVSMGDAGNWDGVKNRLSREGVTSPAEIRTPIQPQDNPPAQIPLRTDSQVDSPKVMAVSTNVTAIESATPKGTGQILDNHRELIAPDVYVSYAWGEDSTDVGRQREEMVNRLCDAVRASGRTIGRDKEVLRGGDSIEHFAQEVSKAQRIIAVISEKSLQSKYCMVMELFSAWRRCNQQLREFQEKVIALVLDDAKLLLADDLKVAKFWKEQYDKDKADLLEIDPDRLSSARWAYINQLGEMCPKLPDILGALKDIVMKRGFDNIVRDNFQEVLTRLPPLVGK